MVSLFVGQEIYCQDRSEVFLKYFLDQNIHTNFQVAGISKLMAFDFSIEYKKGVENKVVDALSRKLVAELLVLSLLTPNDSLFV